MSKLTEALTTVNTILERLDPLDRAKIIRSASQLWDADTVWYEEERRLRREHLAKKKEDPEPAGDPGVQRDP